MNESELGAGLAATPHYRCADLVGDQLFVAGQVPLDGAGQLVGAGDPRAQARQCVHNLLTLVGHHGFAVSDIHRLTLYVVGRHDHLLGAWDEITIAFGHDVPPATLLGVTLLGYRDQLVELDAVVARA